ncbi:WD40 repeat-like protein [Elasticomyces elasticus]|nr:WD40 repeat-like protein [Elasticomyces elasticus]KAK3642698.1 WD40 repeat-like protein [Elasticomyces elasticus]KAK4910150.1 WD40 repeat-like protein [Elasticomyces elasticus]KAK5766418.1 WD40 repeat-like protein [Elasticomyces elasticus]
MSITAEAIWAAAPSTTRGSPTPLSSDSKGQRIAYASGKSIFVRSIDNPADCKQYTQHTAPTTVARFSPSGFYVASGDVSGTVRVWDAHGAENTKGDYHIIAGRINDLAWDGDSQRIIAVGDGKERFGHCITADSGNTVGEISGHSSQINCVSIRQQRPLRAATGSDDTSLCFFHGVPFKFNTSVRGKHDKFVYGTQFSPDGSALVSVGSDRRIWLYDGKTGEATKQIGEGEHKGSIFGVAWSPDSKKIVTCSGDQTVKIWEVESGNCLRSWRMGEEGSVSVKDQQVGVAWPAGRTDGLIISVDLEGSLTYFRESKDAPTRVVRGHQKAITSAVSSPENNAVFTGSTDGRIQSWDLKTGVADSMDGEMHSNYISGIAASNGRIYSVGWDDTLRTLEASQRSFIGSAIKTSGQPKAVVVSHAGKTAHAVVMTDRGITTYTDGGEAKTHSLPSPPLCIAALEGKDIIAVGCEDKRVRIISTTGFDTIAELKDLTHPPSALAFSDSKLAVGLTNGKIFVYAKSTSSGDWELETNRWSAHTARVTSIAWSPSGQHAVSGGLDTNVFVWSISDPGKRIKALNAHKEGVGAVVWAEKDRVVSCGADAAVKVWKVSV